MITKMRTIGCSLALVAGLVTTTACSHFPRFGDQSIVCHSAETVRQYANQHPTAERFKDNYVRDAVRECGGALLAEMCRLDDLTETEQDFCLSLAALVDGDG